MLGTLKPQAPPVHPWSERHGPSRSYSGGAQIFSGRFAGPAVGDEVKADFLPLIEGAHAGAFNRADMNEDVVAAVGGLNEAEALLAVKPLHSSCIHGECPLIDSVHVRLRRQGIGTFVDDVVLPGMLHAA